jgi:hypothetical protein
MKKIKIKWIPNCKLCIWKGGNNIIVCAAQGNKRIENVYNNRLCKKLYDREIKEIDNEKNNTD